VQQTSHVDTVTVQAVCELVYLHSETMAKSGIQLSDVSRPVRAHIRHLYYTSHGCSRADMDGALYQRPASSAAEQLLVIAPYRFPSARTSPGAAPSRPDACYNAPCALVPAAVVPDAGMSEVLMDVPEALQGSNFGVHHRRAAVNQGEAWTAQLLDSRLLAVA
jgi:hypothetical protein